jgi:glutamate carboxypeptidase
MDFKELQSKINDYQPAMLDTLEQLVTHESPSTDKSALDAYARKLSNRFEQLGGEATILANPGAGDQLQVVISAQQANSERPGLLLCHYDTVWALGTIDKQPFRLDGDRVYGPGVYDMKASHVMAEFALKAIADLEAPLPRPIIILFTSDEEIGSLASRELIENQARQAQYVLVLEPPTAEGDLKTARKGVGGFNLSVNGKASHAGSQPERGISAIHELARQIVRLEELADNAAGTTVNVGVVEGGTRSNVIAAKAEAVIDVRAWTAEEAQRVESAIKKMQPLTPGAELEIEGGFDRPPMVRSEAIADLFLKAARVGEKLGMDLQEGSTGGGSDGNFTAALGVPTLDGLGAMGDGAHADYEHILFSHLPQRTALLAALLFDL